MNFAIDQLQQDTIEILEGKFKKDNLFVMEYSSIVEFYSKKLLNFVHTDYYDDLIKEFEEVVQAQFFKGYHVMRVLLEEEGITEEDSYWTWLEGQVKIGVPQLLDEVLSYTDNKDWSHTDIAYNYSIKLLKEIDTAYEFFKSARVEMAYLGAIQAFKDDSRYKGREMSSESLTSYFGRLDDSIFVNPQIYMLITHFEEGKEIWNIHGWKPFNDNEWMGTVDFQHLNTPEGIFYALNINLSYLIREDERYAIINTLYNMLPKDVQASTQIRKYTCSEMEILHK